jgi:chorismate mutase/prephenate dehydratase
MMSLAHRPGALCGVMAKFASIGVNLTKLESRPVRGSDFEFMFIFDFEASPYDPRVLKLLAGFSNDTSIENFTFLGAYCEE